MHRTAAILCCLTLMAACGLPRDASGTLTRVRAGVLRVGIINSPPWVIDDGVEPRGVEAALAGDLARQLGSTIQWTRRPEHTLIRALHDRELDLVIGDLDDTLPWVADAALTRPYYQDERRHKLTDSLQHRFPFRAKMSKRDGRAYYHNRGV